jgi:hypothetical protein
MQIIGTYSRFGYSVEVYDDSGFLLESEEYGNVQYNSPLHVDLEDVEALTDDVIYEFCERSCNEKSYLLGLTPLDIVLKYDPS